MWYEHLRKCQKLRMQLWGHSIAILSLFNYAGFMFCTCFLLQVTHSLLQSHVAEMTKHPCSLEHTSIPVCFLN